MTVVEESAIAFIEKMKNDILKDEFLSSKLKHIKIKWDIVSSNTLPSLEVEFYDGLS